MKSKLQIKKINISKILKEGFIFLFSLRDAFGITIHNLPIRLGELWIILFSIFEIPKKRWRIHKNEISLLYILFSSLIITIIGVILYRESIDLGFAIKYIARNALYLIFIFAFLISNITFSKEDIHKLMKYIVIIEVIFFMALYIFNIYFYLGELCHFSVNTSGQYIQIGSYILPRFLGSASEPGYLSPLLVMPTYYFGVMSIKPIEGICKRNNAVLYLLITIFLSLFTFSSALYFFEMITLVLVVLLNVNKKDLLKYLFTICKIVGVLIIIILLIPRLRDLFYTHIVVKVIAFLSFGNSAGNWSANDRTSHYVNAIKLFLNSSPLQFFIGHGTGGYYAYSQMGATNLLTTNVNEAYNLFLSTLTDRGILGFICIFLLIMNCRLKRIKGDVFSQTVFVGIIMQCLHWLLTGNLWLYYFWYEVIILFAYYRQADIK